MAFLALETYFTVLEKWSSLDQVFSDVDLRSILIIYVLVGLNASSTHIFLINWCYESLATRFGRIIACVVTGLSYKGGTNDCKWFRNPEGHSAAAL